MASVDKVKVGSTSYDISPSKNGTLNGFTSNDAASPTAWSATNAITTSDTNSTIFSKVTTMIKNVRWLYSKLGTTDFSATGQSTVTGALSALQTGLNGKAASSHSHTTAQLPVSSSQTNSNSYIPTSALVYSMQQQINSLNDAINKSGLVEYNDISIRGDYDSNSVTINAYIAFGKIFIMQLSFYVYSGSQSSYDGVMIRNLPMPSGYKDSRRPTVDPPILYIIDRGDDYGLTYKFTSYRSIMEIGVGYPASGGIATCLACYYI